MALLSESLKGVKGGLYSNATDILRCLIGIVEARGKTGGPWAESVLYGVLINSVHHCTTDTFSPLLDVVCDYVEGSLVDGSNPSRSIKCRLILLCVATRKGTRIRDWKRVHKALLGLLASAAQTSDFELQAVEHLLGAVALSIQTSPMDELLQYMRPLMDAVTNERLSQYFLPFCLQFSTAGADRFQNVVLPYFQR